MLQGTINGQTIEFSENETILSAARRAGHFIPTLCEMQDLNHAPGTCRVCLVEIRRNKSEKTHMVTSCNTPMEDGIEVFTRTPRARAMQRRQVELILADHNQDCAVCSRHGDCELQDVAQFVGLDKTRFHYPEFFNKRTRDTSSPAIKREMDKCIRCMRCVTVCREVQGVDALVYRNSGLQGEICVRNSLPLGNSSCVSCGQCILVCPVGALAEADDIEKVIDYLYDPGLVTVFQFAPATRVALGEEFGLPQGSIVEGQMIAGMKKLGADVVLDTNFAADLVIMEEGTELLHRLANGGKLPMFTSCCPGWVNFAEKNYPQLLDNISTTQSPQQCLGAVAKSYLAANMKVDPARMRVVSIMPCTAKKGEAIRPEFSHNGVANVDAVLTTREFARLLKREGIDLNRLEDAGDRFDDPLMGSYSGAAAIFGATGGVMEAALRTVHYVVTGSELPGIDLVEVRGMKRVREAAINLGGEIGEVRVAVAHGIKGARQVAEAVLAGTVDYHFIEVMACPSGCMGGGGQTRAKKSYRESIKARCEALYKLDRNSRVRQSHNNPLIKKLYESYLEQPLSETSHHLLHTHYSDRKQEIRRNILTVWKETTMSNWSHPEYK